MESDDGVGYGKPPKKSQFQAGQSGNPRGRRKGVKNFKTYVTQEFGRPISVSAGGKQRTMPRQHAAAISLTSKAAQGDIKALDAVNKIIPPHGEPVTAEISESDEKIVMAFLLRHGLKPVSGSEQ